MIQPKKVALACAGGLEAAVLIPWLQENCGCEVVAICGDTGQGGDELAALEATARAAGASEVYVEDLREEFVSGYLWKLVRSGAVYEHKYLLGAAIARPLLAKRQVEIALACGCDALSHGAAGRGNDQAGFELTYRAFAPQLPVLAPWRGRDLPAAPSTAGTYSRDRNIWHISHEGGALEDPANAAPDEIWMLTKSPNDAPDRPGEVAIEFEKGLPVAVNGRKMKAFELLETLNQTGSEHGIGRIDLMENRPAGMKSRACYETPGGALIVFAARELEALTLDKSTLHYKQKLALDYAGTVYDGLWFTPLREALDAFFEAAAEPVTGEIRLRLYKGNIDPVSRKSPFSLYSSDMTSSNYEQQGPPVPSRAAAAAAAQSGKQAGKAQ